MASSPTVIRPPVPGRSRTTPRLALPAALALAALAALAGVAPTAAADEPPEMTARVMLEGHARVGGWMGIAIRLRNAGPPVVGELRIAGGAQGRTRFATPVDLPTSSDKTYQLYAQPPAFGSELEVALVAGDRTVARSTVAFRIHDANQLVVGVVAEKPQSIVSGLHLLPDQRGSQPAVVALDPSDLPERVQAWAPLDRLIWQDVDSSTLTPDQLAAMRGWLAGGGRLVLVGGTAGPAVLSGFPDEILPYRPASTIDVAPESIAGLVGPVPSAAADVPALSGTLARGRGLATSGDRAVAAEAAYGTGAVTIVGFDPTAGWLRDADGTLGLWRRLLPARTNTVTVTGDDAMLVNAVGQLPALALPPISGLLVLLVGYIVLVGPINYLVLRRLDRREWAWVTMPLLIALFAVGAYAFGAALRGLDVIVNEVAVVRGAAGATEGTAQVYLGVFSPSRGTYQLEVPGGALLTSTVSGEQAAGDAAGLDIVQGDPARVRDLTVGFGSLRVVRAEAAATVPDVRADLRLDNGTLTGTVRNASDRALERPAVVLGSSVVVLDDLAPGAQESISLPIRPNQFGQTLSDRILGQVFYGEGTAVGERTQRTIVRHAVIDQLTFDPNFGTSVQLDAEAPVLLAWGTGEILDVRIAGQVPRRTGNVLYYIPLPMAVSGDVTFAADLIRSSIVESDAMFFSKDPYSVNFGQGSVTIAYRPITFEGTLAPKHLVLGMNTPGFAAGGAAPQPVEPGPIPSAGPSAEPSAVPCDPNTQPCDGAWDGIPEVELFDRRGEGSWRRLPHFGIGASIDVRDPGRYVDPATGEVLVRFVNDRQDPVSFTFQVSLEATVR